MFICSAIQYIVSKKQPVRSAHDVSVDSSEIAFDEAYFTVNLHSFLQPVALRRHTFLQVSHLSPILQGRTTYKAPLL